MVHYRVFDNVGKMNLSISKTDTSVIKGIAILAMLVHHFYIDTENSWFLEQMQEVGKVCVSLFVLLSGYGLCVGYQALTPPHWEKNAVMLLVRRFVKFYFNYWAVFFIWVPIGILFFDRSFGAAYINNKSIYCNIISDIFAVGGSYSYNITWWFNKLIVILYLLSPVIYIITKRFPIGTFLVVLLLKRILLAEAGVGLGLDTYIVSFVVGFIWALNVENLNRFVIKIPKWGAIIASFGLIIGVAVLRQSNIILGRQTCDTYLAIAICLLVLSCKPYKLKIDTILGFLGKHSINIYLMHTFVFSYFWHEEISSLENKFLIFIVTLGICLAFLIILEFLKEKLKYNQLAKSIVKFIEKRGIIYE